MGRLWAFLFAVALWASPAHATDSYTVANGSNTNINEWGVCKNVANGHASGKSIYVPTLYQNEWATGTNAFTNSTIPGVTQTTCFASQSVRFRSSATSYLTRTPGAAGNQQKFTWSGWVKRGTLAVQQELFSTNGTPTFGIRFGSAGTGADDLEIFEYNGGFVFDLITTQDFVDPSAWYHIVVAVDSTQATAANRVKLYVNGNQVTSFSTATYPTQNLSLVVNSTGAHYLGRYTTSVQYFDGYMAEVNLIDGQQLDASSFGQLDPTSGQWEPISYSGAYGTNGFYLRFGDTSSLGKDSSGNGNTWTATNFSTTPGTTYDPVYDYAYPAIGGADNGVGNYATLDPNTHTSTFSNGNLQVAGTQAQALSSLAMCSGKWYAEFTPTTIGSQNVVIGIDEVDQTVGPFGRTFGYDKTGNKLINGSGSAWAATYTTGNVIGVAFDADAGSITFYKNGVSQGVMSSAIPADCYRFGIGAGGTAGSDVYVANFGQRAFSYTPPSGFSALNTFNLAAPAIVTPSAYFSSTVYTGNGGTKSITGLGFQPDLVIIKGRSGATAWAVYDSARGVQKDFDISSAAETTQATGLTSFNSDGFTLGALAKVNTNTATYLALAFKEGVTPGLDIVTYTGTGANTTVNHSLGVAPAMVWVKAKSGTGSWVVYHTGQTSAAYYTALDSSNGESSLATVWNSTAPTSTNFSLGSHAAVNANGTTYVAYAWAEVPGFSKFGSFTGNGSADGPFIYTGFKPALVVVKRTSASGNGWFVEDAGRNVMNGTNYANTSFESTQAETCCAAYVDYTANGFKIRSTSAGINASSARYIYMAFAEAGPWDHRAPVG